MQDFESRISIPTPESVFKEFREIVGRNNDVMEDFRVERNFSRFSMVRTRILKFKKKNF